MRGGVGRLILPSLSLPIRVTVPAVAQLRRRHGGSGRVTVTRGGLSSADRPASAAAGHDPWPQPGPLRGGGSRRADSEYGRACQAE